MRIPRSFIPLAPVLLLALGIGIFLALPRDTYHALKGLRGPEGKGLPGPLAPADWRPHSKGEPSRLAVLITDANSAWVGVQNALETMGVPYIITDDAEEAAKHRVVLVYPMISGKVLDREEQEHLRRHVSEGGCLLATQVLGGDLKDLFGFGEVQETRTHFEMKFSPGHELTSGLDHERERTVRLGNPQRPGSLIGTQYYEGAEEVLATYQDGQAAWIAKQHPGGGVAMALGLDLGFFILRCQNDRDDESSRSYANGYEPSLDIWLRLLRGIYQKHEPLAVTVDTVPDGKRIAAVMSFDIDYVKSMSNMTAYRDLLLKNEVPATFFIQAKYYRDYFDSGFFNDETIGLLRGLQQSGMEIASHSVAHSDVFAHMPLGSGAEQYPDYQPRVRGFENTEGGSVLGELRVSKYLLEKLVGGEVRSFRPGFLACPPALAESLEASGYRYASSVTAGNVLTYLPYRKSYNHEYAGTTGIFEFPAAVEDEHPPKMDQRVDSAMELANQLAEYGGTFVVLSHPDVLEHKYRFFEAILPRLKPMAWIGTLGQLGDWWSARDQMEIDVARSGGGESGGQIVLSIKVPVSLKGVTLLVPERWKVVDPLPEGARLENGRLFLPEVAGKMTMVFAEG